MNFETVFGPQNWSAGHGLNNFEHFKIFTILRRFYLTIDISGAVIFAMQSLRYWFRVKYHLFEKKISVGFLQHTSDINRFISNKVANQRHWPQPYKLTTKNQDHCIRESWIANVGCVKEPKMCSQETLLLSFMIYRHLYINIVLQAYILWRNIINSPQPDTKWNKYQVCCIHLIDKCVDFYLRLSVTN